MAEEHQNHDGHQSIEVKEVKDRGLFDFMGKKEEKVDQSHDQEVIVTEFEEVKVEEEEEKNQEKHGVLEKLHRSDSSSSSSSEEEEEGEKKKKKKKKGMKEKIKEKMTGEKKEEEEKKGEEETKTNVSSVLVTSEENTSVTVEKVDCTTEQVQVLESSSTAEEKKGLFDKMKEKLPGHPKKPTTEDCSTPAAAPPPMEQEPERAKEKKGFLGKIMEKIPGYHKSTMTTTTGDRAGDQGSAAH